MKEIKKKSPVIDQKQIRQYKTGLVLFFVMKLPGIMNQNGSER